ncbi:MAG: GNAT family N-acetyltransferase [Clostridia bacterium]|nr:GNAT family N-acetyltransferase [Clostridia bacterium]
MITFADRNDKTQLEKMWQSIFLEEDTVTGNFFENIFDSTVTPVIKVDGEIVSSLFLLDCRIGDYKGKCVYCAMTKYAHRGKGYMKKLLDFSYNYCTENNFDFLFLVPAEKSLFDYYEACGFSKFGISRVHTINDTIPNQREMLKCDCQIEFDNSVAEYWAKACTVYGGEVTDFGFVFDDEEKVIRNANGKYENIPEKHKISGTIIKGNITFGEDYSPAMIKTENEKIKKIDCYIGITLE